MASPYIELHRDIIISADIYGGIESDPSILSASMGFEGIISIPGFNSEDDIQLAYDAGAGVVSELLGLEPVAPLRNITSGLGQTGYQFGGYANNRVTESFLDAMPIEFSHPVLPSTVLPENFRIRLNSNETVIPLYVGLIPNYDFNERQTVVVMGYFSNGLPTSNKDALYPVQFDVVNSNNPLQLVTPSGLFDGSGLTATSSNPYDPLNGPRLVGAKLSLLSLAGDYTNPSMFNGANHGIESYGNDKDLYRLRLFTSGGFSPDGASGLLPDDFANFFQLTAFNSKKEEIIISESGTVYEVHGGSIEILGIADLGGDLDGEEYLYVEDHDNQFDIIIKATSRKAAKAIQSVVLPDPELGTHRPIYNPGGPGTNPIDGLLYTEPSPGQVIDVEHALKDPGVVSWASQSLDEYDSDDDLSVAFRLHNHKTGEWRLTDSSKRAFKLSSRKKWEFVDVPFAVNPTDSYVSDVFELRHKGNMKDSVYTVDKEEIESLEQIGYVNKGVVFTAYKEPMVGLDPIYQFITPNGNHVLTASSLQAQDWEDAGWTEAGISFYSVGFPNIELG